MATIKDAVNLSEDETIIREYHVIDRAYVPILSRGVEGRLAITNKRVIGRSEITVAGGKRIEFNSVPLDKVEGVNLVSGYSTSWKILIGGIAAIIFGIFSLDWGIGIIFIIVGIIAVIFAFKNEVIVGVRAASITRRGMISVPEPQSYLLLSESGFRVFKVQGPDVDALMRGLDMVIMEVKKRGAEVLKDLKCPNPECSYVRAIDETPPKHCPECGTAWGG